MQFSKYDNFWDWSKGKIGFLNVFIYRSCSQFQAVTYLEGYITKDALKDYVYIEERHPYYLWFRTPEVIFNPQGAFYNPLIAERTHSFMKRPNDNEVVTFCEKEDIIGTSRYCTKPKKLYYHCTGRTYQSEEHGSIGLVDGMVLLFTKPKKHFGYKNSNCSEPFKYIYVLFETIGFSIFLLPFYMIHDILKTAMLPVAAMYYSVQHSKFGERKDTPKNNFDCSKRLNRFNPRCIK